MQIKLIKLGITNCYLIKGNQGYILVDTGSLRKGNVFKRKLKGLGISPTDIKLIITTHAHYDHIGSLAVIKEMCGCPVAISPAEGNITREGLVVIPPGTNPVGKLVSLIGNKSKWFLRFPKCEVELLIEQEFPLDEYGVAGRIIPTPGHTPGSLSVLLDSGEAMVGDLAMNMPAGKFYPLFAEQPREIYISWQELIARGARRIYPAHGAAFEVAKLENHLQCGST